jgi:iron(III) transport system substrate-binding protein
MTRALGFVTLGAVLAALLAGCGGSKGPSIVVYNGQHPELTQALVAAFQKQTGIKVNMRTNDSVVLADQLLSEGSHTPADVFISENSPEMMMLEQHGFLSKLDASTLAQIPAQDNSPTGQWVGLALRVSSLVYDASLQSAAKLPKSVLDLAQPQWKGKIAIARQTRTFRRSSAP